MSCAGNRGERFCFRIKYRKQAGGHVEMGGMQVQLPTFDQVAHIGKCHEIVERLDRRGMFQMVEVVGEAGMMVLRPDRSGGRRKQFHPFADEVALRQRLAAIGKGANAAAMCMSEHDDMFDFQRLHSELDRFVVDQMLKGKLLMRSAVGCVVIQI